MVLLGPASLRYIEFLYKELSTLRVLKRNAVKIKNADLVISVLAEIETLESEINTHLKHNFYAQSAEVGLNESKATTVEIHETLGLIDSSADTNETDYKNEVDYGMVYKGTPDLTNFFKRPIEIYNSIIPLGSDFDISRFVWNDYLKDPIVRAKFKNYALMRADLHIRISLSGTPFHFGRVLVSWYPLANVNSTLAYYDGGGPRNNKLKYFSQNPWSRVMDVSSNESIELTCPYINTAPMLRLFNQTDGALLAADDIVDALSMGKLYVTTLNKIQAVSTSPTAVYLQVYAWLENVSLAAPTASYTYVANSSEIYSGPVETLSTRMAILMKKFHSVPILGAYATAASKFFGGMGDVASVLGFSTPSLETGAVFVKNNPFSNLAHCIRSDTSFKLTVDPQQEIVQNPSLTGASVDEMTLDFLNARESFLGSFNWNLDDIPLEHVNMHIPVNPCVASAQGGAGVFEYQPSSLHFAAQPFTYWHGDITYRLEFVISKFHRGKMLLIYEPNINQAATILSVPASLNKQYVHIIDIQESPIYEFTISWCQNRPWLRSLASREISFNAVDFNDLGVPGTVYSGYANGFFYLVPFTQLQSPISDTINVNVYCRSDNMHYNYLNSDHFTNNLPDEGLFLAQSHLIERSYITTELNSSNYSIKNLHTDWFGESPISYRTMLKRFHKTAEYNVNTNDRCVLLTDEIFRPLTQPPGISRPTYYDLLSYLRYAYLGMRGSLKKIYRVDTSITGRTELGAFVEATLGDVTAVATPGLTGIGYEISTLNYTGSALFSQASNAGIEVEVPYFSNNLFLNPNSTNITASAQSDDFLVRTVDVLFQLPYSVSANNVSVSAFTATGEDFSLMGYIGAPPIISNH